VLNKADVIAFVPTTNPDRAREFYEDVLGLQLLADEPSALVFDANGVILRVAKVNSLYPAPYTILGWKVSDLLETINDLNEKGVAFERYHGLSQDHIGVWTSLSGTQVVWFKDPDGNLLTLTQSK
jgi:catechol 2,3-dioxygenase-like lactoylglutathione lyase family enzyme